MLTKSKFSSTENQTKNKSFLIKLFYLDFSKMEIKGFSVIMRPCCNNKWIFGVFIFGILGQIVQCSHHDLGDTINFQIGQKYKETPSPDSSIKENGKKKKIKIKCAP